MRKYGKPNAHLLEKHCFAEKNLVLRFDKPDFALINQGVLRKTRFFNNKFLRNAWFCCETYDNKR